MLAFKARWNVPVPISEPDLYSINLEQGLMAPCPDQNFIISRTKTGEVLSRYSDDIWDLSPYTQHARASRVIYFKKSIPNSPESEIILCEYKWMLFLLIFISDHGRSNFISVSTIYQHSNVISSVAQYCLSKNITIHNLLSSDSALASYFKSSSTETSKGRFLGIISAISAIDFRISGFKILDEAIKFNISIKKNSTQQTIIIPPRIFSTIILSCQELLNGFIVISKNFLELAKIAHFNTAFARSKGRQRANVPGIKTFEADFATASKKLQIESYALNAGICDLHGVSRHLRKVQYACKLLIHIYTGMRDNEVSSLKYDCFHKENSVNGRIFRILGDTTKLIGLRKSERWVTSQEVEPAINLAKQISKTIAECMGRYDDDHILFLPVSNLEFSPNQKNARRGNQAGFYDLRHSICSVIIEKSDIKDLEQMYPNAAWLEDPTFQVGAVWPLATHQFRRTLAVYATNSGLVSLPSLKRQLKHLSKEMTLYYASGSSYAKTIFGVDKIHFKNHYNELKSYGEGLGYIYNLLLSKHRLYGVFGNWLEKHDRKVDEFEILEKREETIKQFKRGDLAYSETPLGACLSRGPCDKKAMRAVSACISCDKAVIIEYKLEKVVLTQQLLLGELNPTSMEYRMEKEQLDDLKRFQAHIRK